MMLNHKQNCAHFASSAKKICLSLTLRSSTLSSAVSSLSSTGISLSRMDDKTEDNRLQQHKASSPCTSKARVCSALHGFVGVEQTCRKTLSVSGCRPAHSMNCLQIFCKIFRPLLSTKLICSVDAVQAGGRT